MTDTDKLEIIRRICKDVLMCADKEGMFVQAVNDIFIVAEWENTNNEQKKG